MHSGTYLLHSPVIIYWHRNWTPPIFFKIQSYWKRVVDTSPNHAPSHAKEYCISHRWSVHKCQFILSKVRPFDSKLVVCRARRNIQLRRNLNPAKLNSLNVLVLVLYSHTLVSSACHNHTILFVRFFCGCGWQKKSSILGGIPRTNSFPMLLNIFLFSKLTLSNIQLLKCNFTVPPVRLVQQQEFSCWGVVVEHGCAAGPRGEEEVAATQMKSCTWPINIGK